jgi:hypothetical protein
MNEPKNGDFASYVEELGVRQQSKLAASGQKLLELGKQPAKPVAPKKAATPAAFAAQTPHKPNLAPAASKTSEPAKPSAKPPATQRSAVKPSASEPDRKPAAQADEKATDANELPAPTDDWERQWQPVFMFVVMQRKRLVGMSVALAAVLSTGFCLLAAFGLTQNWIAPETLPDSGVLGVMGDWAQTLIEHPARALIVLLVFLFATVYLLKHALQVRAAVATIRELSIATLNPAAFWPLVIGLSVLEVLVFFKIGIGGLFWLIALTAGGATKLAWKAITRARKTLFGSEATLRDAAKHK